MKKIANLVAAEMNKLVSNTSFGFEKSASKKSCCENCKCDKDCSCKGKCSNDCSNCSDMSKKSEQEFLSLLISASEKLDNMGFDKAASLSLVASEELMSEMCDKNEVTVGDVFTKPSESLEWVEKPLKPLEEELIELEEDPSYLELNKVLEDKSLRKMLDEVGLEHRKNQQIEEMLPVEMQKMPELPNDLLEAFDKLYPSEDEMQEWDKELKNFLKEQGLNIEELKEEDPEAGIDWNDKLLKSKRLYLDKNKADDSDLEKLVKNVEKSKESEGLEDFSRDFFKDKPEESSEDNKEDEFTENKFEDEELEVKTIDKPKVKLKYYEPGEVDAWLKKQRMDDSVEHIQEMIEYFNNKVDKILDGTLKVNNPDERLVALMNMIKEYEEVLEEKKAMENLPDDLKDLGNAIDSLNQDFEDEE